MRFGIFPPVVARRGELPQLFKEACQEVQAAEDYGFDSCLIGEHHQQRGDYITAPLLVAAAMAAVTKRIKIGTGVLLLPLYHPVHVAEDVAVLDNISQGRAFLGVGIGYQEQDFRAFGISIRHRASLMEESLEVLRRCWIEERFSFHGRHFDLEDVAITPKPLQKPHPPIWVAGWSDEGLRRAARHGDAWLADPIQGFQTIKIMAEKYREMAKQGKREAKVVLMREAWIADSRAQAMAEFEPAVRATHWYYFKNNALSSKYDPWLAEVKAPGDLTLERLSHDRFILGTPKDCIEQIRRWHEELGIDDFVLVLRHGVGPPHERVMEAIRLFGEKVIPRFQ